MQRLILVVLSLSLWATLVGGSAVAWAGCPPGTVWQPGAGCVGPGVVPPPPPPPPGVVPPPPPAPPLAAPPPPFVVYPAQLNLRVCPGLGCAVTAVLYAGQPVQPLRNERGFWYVYVPALNINGWVAQQFVGPPY